MFEVRLHSEFLGQYEIVRFCLKKGEKNGGRGI